MPESDWKYHRPIQAGDSGGLAAMPGSIQDEPLTPGCCLRCRAAIWMASGSYWFDDSGRRHDLGFDLVGQGEGRMLLVHSCEDDEEYDEFDLGDPVDAEDDDG